MSLEEYLRYQYRGYEIVPRSFILDEVQAKCSYHRSIVSGMFPHKRDISVDEMIYAIIFIIGEIDGD